MVHCCLCTHAVRLALMMSSDFSCSTCGETFTNPWNLNRHNKFHDENWILKCEHCWFKTKRSDNLKTHLDRYHQNIESSQEALVEQPETPTDYSSKQPVLPKLSVLPLQASDFDKRLQLPNNFVYAGSTQSVRFICFSSTI